MVADDFERTKEDPVTFFRLRAMKLAGRLGVSIPEVDDAVGLVVSALGVAWLNEVAEDFSESSALPFRRHHLGDVISTAGEPQVAEILELATYLRLLADVHGVGTLIDGLRAQYHQTMLQVAFSARIKIVGGDHLVLEPSAVDGRLGDLRFDLDGTPYQVECFRPTVKGIKEADHEMVRIAQGAINVSNQSAAVLAIAVALNVEPSAGIRSEIMRMVRAGVSDVTARGKLADGSLPAISVAGPAATVAVSMALPTRAGSRPILVRPADFPFQGDDWDTCIRASVAHAADLAGLDGDFLEGQGLNSCAVWLPPELRDARSGRVDLGAVCERLGRAIEKKLVQARGKVDARRLVVVDSWLTERLVAGEEALAERLRGKIVRSHPGVSALLMVRRTWMHELGRHGYLMKALQPDDAALAIPAEFLSRLRNVDVRP